MPHAKDWMRVSRVRLPESADPTVWNRSLLLGEGTFRPTSSVAKPALGDNFLSEFFAYSLEYGGAGVSVRACTIVL